MRNWKFFDSDFASYPCYSGNDLGVCYSKEQTQIRIWAPSAIQVELRIYRQAIEDSAIRIDQFAKAESGTWEITLQGDLNGYFYTIRINDGTWLNETPGIDARAVGANGIRGLIFDEQQTNPEGWETDQRVKYHQFTEAILYELHIRDFSISPSSGIQYKVKFLAFTESGTR